MELLVVPIHKHPELLLECCKLINSEWKRSDTARIHSLKKSCDTLPVNLVLLNENEVIGHAQLSVIPSINDSCFVESVVIKGTLRGQGYGSYLMKRVGEYCKDKLHLNFIHLSTKGQEKFYQKLGYTECGPIQLYGTPKFKIVQSTIFNPADKQPFLPSKQKSNLLHTLRKTYMYKSLN